MVRPHGSLPYVRISRVGKLEYFRRIPKALRPYLGNRASICRVLPCDTTDKTSPQAHSAWLKVHTSVTQLITDAEAAQQADQVPAATALAPRDIAGVAAEPWRLLLEAGDAGEITPEIQQQLAEITASALLALQHSKSGGDIGSLKAALADIHSKLLSPTLEKLEVSPDSETLGRLINQSRQYQQMFADDVNKRAKGDWTTPDIASKPPPLPVKQVEWTEFMRQYQLDVGGITEEDGIGVGEERIKRYWLSIQDVIDCTGKYYPLEITIDLARKYLNHLQKSDLSIRTQQDRLTMIKNLFKIAMRVGLTTTNPFETFVIKVAKGQELATYRPFTREELQRLIPFIKSTVPHERYLAIILLLTTGARLSEIICLRNGDLKQTKAGVWYLDMTHDPNGKYPRTLKTGRSNQRCVPLHPFVINRGLLDVIDPRKEGYVYSQRVSEGWSKLFARRLKTLEMYEKRETTIHSLRNSAIDEWRMAGVPSEVRHSWTGHTLPGTQDQSYGQGLRQQPDTTAKELSKLDWSWLEP